MHNDLNTSALSEDQAIENNLQLAFDYDDLSDFVNFVSEDDYRKMYNFSDQNSIFNPLENSSVFAEEIVTACDMRNDHIETESNSKLEISEQRDAPRDFSSFITRDWDAMLHE